MEGLEVSELHSSASSLLTKFQEGNGTADDIDEAIGLERMALELCPPGHPLRSRSLIVLSKCLSHRYDQIGATENLDEAIVLAREVLEIDPPSTDNGYFQLTLLAHHLSTLYHRFGQIEVLDEAISLEQEALILCPPGDPNLPTCLSNLAIDLAVRFERLGGPQDLDQVIDLTQEALECFAPESPERCGPSNNLALYLIQRYNKRGMTADLERAVTLARETLILCPHGHPERSGYMNNLAIHLSTRYKQLGAREDLDEAINLVREALQMRPPGHPSRPKSLRNLANILYSRYKQLGAMEDQDEAIALEQEAVDFQPPGSLHRSASVVSLTNYLSERYEQLGQVEDINKAVNLDREVLNLLPPGDPALPMYLNRLARRLYIRYRGIKAMDDLDEAIYLNRKALTPVPPGHPERSYLLENLTLHLSVRFKQSSQLKDKEELFSLYAELARVTTVSSYDLSATRSWIRAAEDFQHPSTLQAYETALRLLTQHLTTLSPVPRYISVLDDFTSLGVDAFSAGLRNGSPTRAVELLEQGRGLFWSQLARLDDVVASGPTGKALAEKLTETASAIRRILDTQDRGQEDELHRLATEFQGIIDNIRDQPGLLHFLLPSPFSDFQQAASKGPVIIVNASRYGCDALVIFLDQDPVHIPLRITEERVQELSSKFHILMERAVSMDVTTELASYLQELWDEVVSPIAKFLQTILPPQSHIWWCPTSVFSHLPLHAAGLHGKDQQNFSDLYISSYTPALTALIRARRPSLPNSINERKCFAAIRLETGDGASEELANIGQHISGIATFTHIEGAESNIARVAQELGKNEWVHLACPRLPNHKQPFESALVLHDGHLTIERIIQCEFGNPEFAYLSAGHMTIGGGEYLDEAIHLASAMLFAGFRAVIWTMWAVDEAAKNKITSKFYENIVDKKGHLDYTRAALVLHETMKSLVDLPLDQRILYVHLGA